VRCTDAVQEDVVWVTSVLKYYKVKATGLDCYDCTLSRRDGCSYDCSLKSSNGVAVIPAINRDRGPLLYSSIRDRMPAVSPFVVCRNEVEAF